MLTQSTSPSALRDSAGAGPRQHEVRESGEQITEAGPGSLNCIGCGFAFSVAALDALPQCPNCGGSRFRRASIFSRAVDVEPREGPEPEPDWLPGLRRGLEPGGHYLAFEDGDGEPRTVMLQQGWTRIGRSSLADIQINDVTVSRRHALVVLTEEGEVRALDDRSLNGLFVNGEHVDWARLSDGDELEIGRYRMHLIAT